MRCQCHPAYHELGCHAPDTALQVVRPYAAAAVLAARPELEDLEALGVFVTTAEVMGA